MTHIDLLSPADAGPTPSPDAHALAASGDWAGAERAYDSQRAAAERAGDDVAHAVALTNRGHALARLGRLADADAALRASLAVRERLHARGTAGGAVVARGLADVAVIAAARGDVAAAARTLRHARTLADAVEVRRAVDGLLDATRALGAPDEEESPVAPTLTITDEHPSLGGELTFLVEPDADDTPAAAPAAALDAVDAFGGIEPEPAALEIALPETTEPVAPMGDVGSVDVSGFELATADAVDAFDAVPVVDAAPSLVAAVERTELDFGGMDLPTADAETLPATTPELPLMTFDDEPAATPADDHHAVLTTADFAVAGVADTVIPATDWTEFDAFDAAKEEAPMVATATAEAPFAEGSSESEEQDALDEELAFLTAPAPALAPEPVLAGAAEPRRPWWKRLSLRSRG